MGLLQIPSGVDEARDNLRIIRETMERSTKHSSLSGVAGLLIGVWAILGVEATRRMVGPAPSDLTAHPTRTMMIWGVVLVVSAFTELVLNKRRAASVGKKIFSTLGARIVQAAGPSFFAGAIVTEFLFEQKMLGFAFAFWMLAYGLAICAVGTFSVRPVSVLGWAFIVAGTIALGLGPAMGLTMMAIAFGGLHIGYGLYTGVTRGDW